MSREALHESLSAVMDNEADELELRRVLAGDNPELRATWSRYQLARAAMHKELIEPRLDIAAAVSAALADEAAPVTSSSGPAGEVWDVSRWRLRSRWLFWQVYACTIRTKLPVRSLPSKRRSRPSVPQANQGPTVLAGYSEQAELPAQTAESAPVERWHEERLPSYVRQHAQQAAFGTGSESALPYARAASMEER